MQCGRVCECLRARPVAMSEAQVIGRSTVMAVGKLFNRLPCWSTSHRQNDAELCVAAQHARVGLGHFFERVRLDHGTHAAQFGEAQCVL